MRFFLDENFPKSAERYLVSRGHTVFDIRGSSEEGIDDLHIFKLAQQKEAVFLTTDRDFFHTIPHLFPRHFGIVIIALRQPNRQAILSRLYWFIERYEKETLNGKAYLLREHSYKVYPIY